MPAPCIYLYEQRVINRRWVKNFPGAASAKALVVGRGGKPKATRRTYSKYESDDYRTNFPIRLTRPGKVFCPRELQTMRALPAASKRSENSPRAASTSAAPPEHLQEWPKDPSTFACWHTSEFVEPFPLCHSPCDSVELGSSISLATLASYSDPVGRFLFG